MLYNLQPDRSVTGGAWYSDQDFESEFVEVLNQQCFKFLQSKVQDTGVTSSVTSHQREQEFMLASCVGSSTDDTSCVVVDVLMSQQP